MKNKKVRSYYDPKSNSNLRVESLSNVNASMHFPFRRKFLLSLYDFETLVYISQKPIGNNQEYSMLHKKYLRL